MNQINPRICTLENLINNTKYEEFIDERTKESQLADLEECLVRCEKNDILEAVFSLDNFIAPFSYMLDESISDYEKACIKLMIESISAKLNYNCIKGHKPIAQHGNNTYICERCGKRLE